eukprot:m.44740 g.44740  ORF g.44740 m.44740 type:complete len:54 (-) comp12125_c1_seq1:1039-1200(-)
MPTRSSQKQSFLGPFYASLFGVQHLPHRWIKLGDRRQAPSLTRYLRKIRSLFN